jgi:hypothetical protein
MRFQVPQFIEVEDKIFGPLTLRQFIYLAGGGGLAFLIYVLIGNIFIAVFPMLLIMSAVVALSFFPVNNRPLIDMVEAAFKYWINSKLFIWRKDDKLKSRDDGNVSKEPQNLAGVMVPKVSGSKLKDLSWSLDIKESIYSNKNQR